MTREEAINALKEIKDRAWRWHINDQVLGIDYDEFIEIMDAVLLFFDHISREQVEKVFPGCEMCREKKKVKSDNFCGAATMQIVGDSIDLRGDEKKIKFFGHIYAPSFSVKFCPFCSRPLTDEAVEMVMEKLEALKDAES